MGGSESSRTPVPSERARPITLRGNAIEAANAVGVRILRWLDGYFRRHSLVGDHTFFDSAQFAWIAALEPSWTVIRRELDDLLRYHDELPTFQDIISHERHLTTDTGWKTYFFFGYGREFEKSMLRCPETARLLKQIPGVTSAMFSILSPAKHIPPHVGPYAGVLRYHLALRVPEPAVRCAIRVRNDVRHWEEGRSLVFDDVFEHEVWNETEGLRVVLFVDFKRPLRGLPRLLNDVFITLVGLSPYVRDASARQTAWEERFERLRLHFPSGGQETE
jgi:aspartyl/asparaginyl beta-hydroxylase (cupin superfamily)